MRFRIAMLLVALPAWAQSNQNAEPPSGQTLLNGLIGKEQASPSRGGEPLSSGGATQETREQREHYKNKDASKGFTTSRSAPGNPDD